jgi:LPXTG-motif cell wall-anchored protein
MSEAMSDAISSLRDHAPSLPSAKDAKEAVMSSLPSAKDAKDAVRSHLPSASDAKNAVKDRLPEPTGKRSVMAMVAGLLALGALAFAVLRRKSNSQPAGPSIYTPPLPKP